ncbi:MAG TPA: intradiol ring-cleavage dioxygenase [Nocardioidaceae bacterium]|nr:intradiol ring-cleavage dioxygenase [Nocardioidaceae bacterium]
MDHHEIEDHDRGLSHDLPTLLNRRRALSVFGGLGLAATLAACGDSVTTNETSPPTASGGGGPGGGSSTAVGDGEIPEETNGPYPADGSNGPNILTESGIVRSDIRSSFGGASGVAAGVPLTLTMSVVDVSSAEEAGTPARGAAVYAWHADAEGRYSMYSEGVEGENYLRGVQEADADGKVTFTTVFPGCYAGRWPHIHFEVYPSLADATAATNRQRTSQLAFPQDVCEQVYASDGYPSSSDNLARLSLDTDMVFSDGYSLQLAKTTGSVDEGFTATLRVPI